jgi:dipeptidyl-peptidase-4
MPVTLLLDRQGRAVQTLETGHASHLPDNWQWPEPVMLKAADGRTDIYAVVFRPSDFCPEQSYPVLDCSCGDNLPVGSFTNGGAMGTFYAAGAAYAELGFVVVMVASRGTGLRSKAFRADKLSGGCDCPNIPDHIAAIEQLAHRYPYMDLSRVGAVTQTSSALAAYALLQYPDFYRVGIAVNACLDWRLSGAFVEEYYSAGLPAEHDNKTELYELADNLTGKLLIVHGMMDNVIPVAAAFRLIEALQVANKHVDMLLLPNLGHGPSHYVQRYVWDYMLRHLRGEEPPEAFVL